MRERERRERRVEGCIFGRGTRVEEGVRLMVEMGDREVGDRLYTLCSSSLRNGSSPPWSSGFLIGKRSHHFGLIWKYSTHAKACPRIRLMSARSRCERQYPTAKWSTPTIRIRKYLQLIEFLFPFPIHTAIIPSSSDALLTRHSEQPKTKQAIHCEAAQRNTPAAKTYLITVLYRIFARQRT